MDKEIKLIDIKPSVDSNLTLSIVTDKLIKSGRDFEPFYASGDMIINLQNTLKGLGINLTLNDTLIIVTKELSDAFGNDIAQTVFEYCYDFLSKRKEFESMKLAGMSEVFFETYSTTFDRVYGNLEEVVERLSLEFEKPPEDKSENSESLSDIWNDW